MSKLSFVPVPNVPVVNDFESSDSCFGIFLNRRNEPVDKATYPPSTEYGNLNDPGLSRYFLYDEKGKWVHLGSHESYGHEECEFYKCDTVGHAEQMAQVWADADANFDEGRWQWTTIPDEELGAYLKTEADWVSGYVPIEDEDDTETKLNREVCSMLDKASNEAGCGMLKWNDHAIAADIVDDSEILKMYAKEDWIHFIRAWRERNTPHRRGYVVFKYKDSHRTWWKLEIWDSEEEDFDTKLHDLDTGGDKIWTYSLSQESGTEEDGWHRVHQANVVGQYDTRPDINHFMGDYMNTVNHMALGISRHFNV